MVLTTKKNTNFLSYMVLMTKRLGLTKDVFVYMKAE